MTADDLTNLRPEQKRALLEQLLRERNAKPASLPLSSAQKRLWFLDKLHPESPVYNVPTVLRLSGPLHLEEFRNGLRAVLERHQSLRTTFAPDEDSAFQKINPPGPVNLVFTDLSATAGKNQTREAEKVMADEVRRPFDLAQDPMLRATLLRIAAEEHILILVTHHIASDEWSLRLLLKEWAESYRAQLERRTPHLPPLPIQYADFAVWQQEWLQGDSFRQQLEYWRERLKGAAALQLPTSRPRPVEQTFNGAQCSATFAPELAQQLKQFSKEREVTLFMTLLTAFQVLLHRYSQQNDIVVGCPIAGRTRVETESLIGFFVNTLALRTTVAGGDSFQQLLSQVRENTLGAYAHQDVPFEKIVEEIHPERSSNRMPLVQVMFALNNEYVDEQMFPGVQVEEIAINTGTAKFDLTFVAKDTSEGLNAVIEYNSDLFDEPAIRRMLAHYEQLLRGFLAHPDEAISRLPVLTLAEREQIVGSWNQTSTLYPKNQCVHQIFEIQAAQRPDATAIKYGDQTITYRELNARANQLAHYLHKDKAGGKALVGVYLDRSIEMIVAFLGILKAGAAYVPLDLSYPKDRIAFMIADTQMRVILTDSKKVGDLPDSTVAKICLDEQSEAIRAQPRQLPPSGVTPESIAYVIYTSGSTGQPKGVPVPHRGITRLVCHTDYVEITPSDHIAQASNASFDAATFEIWGALLNGACVVGMSKETALSPQDFAEALRDEEISILFLTTALFNQLAREVPGVFSSLKTVLFGGEAVDPKWVQAVLACDPPQRLLHVYGPTENTTFSTWHPVAELSEDDGTVPIGKPIANSEAYILDAHLQPVPIGVTGELYVGGDGLALGYWNRPELTAEKFISHPFRANSAARLYRTGDAARFDESGNVEFMGRLDQQVKLRGFRIELGEIEALLARHPAVGIGLVMLREDVPGDKRLVAYLVPKGPAPDPAELRNHLKSQLPDYMVPSAFVFLEAFPLTPNEKVDRKALPVPEQNRPALNKSFVAPRDAVEQQLAKIWEKVLGVQPIGVADNFFDLGGHSLLAVKVFSQIEKNLGKKLPLATLFRAPTIEQIASVLRDENQTKSWSTIVDIQPKGSRPPFFWIHTLGGDGGGGFFYYRKLAELLGPDQPSFGIRSPEEPFTRIEEMARFYLKEIRRFQPGGPYFLGGFCFGGNVAYEMAHQLAAAGEEIGLLVMLETAPPNVSSKQAWSATAAKYSIENLVENVKDFVNHSPQQRLEMLRSKGKKLKQKLRGKMASASPDDSTAVQLKDVIDLKNYPDGYVKYAETHWQALTDYQPQSYPGEIVLFRAKKQGLSNFNHTLG
ncbi:MAG TPA: amino acid adenylation domain-containing protein, partial [Verrucomicrobiae bacterium]|nr:amino acid adenylation domain-containing protein [Verrucomicrobiae bacterium]